MIASNICPHPPLYVSAQAHIEAIAVVSGWYLRDRRCLRAPLRVLISECPRVTLE